MLLVMFKWLLLLPLLTTTHWSCWAQSSTDDIYDMDASNNDNDEGRGSDRITNPYYSGCLYERMPGWTKKRVCVAGTIDDDNADLCRPPPFEEYLEIRIGAGNWDSATALGWLVQIILSEIAGVPTSFESGAADSSRDFYDPVGRVDYHFGLSSTAAMRTVKKLPDGDCRKVVNANKNNPDGDYQPCSHFIPETRGFNDKDVRDKIIEPPSALGVLGTEAWFLTKFTADEYPELVSYHGLVKPDNRELLANLFKRPTTWGDYCSQVEEANHCTTPNGVAERAPHNDTEAERMFVPGLYTGHFRETPKNNCTMFPNNCTGHIANYPCGWMSNMETNLHYLHIALDSKNGPNDGPNGYSTQQLRDMWDAANATKSHLMMMWWKPEALFQKYLGTDAEMQQVYLKPYTQECHRAREYLKDECALDLETRIGNASEACENPTEPLRKLTNYDLEDTLEHPDIPLEAQSPAYDVLRRFQITDVQLEALFDLLETTATPRDAVCRFAVDHYDMLASTVPTSWPRVTRETSESPLGYVALILACVATLIVIVTAGLVYVNRNQLAIKYAQIDFLSFLLVGSFLVCVGSILASLQLSTHDGACMAGVWLVYVGYTLELAPLMIKTSAINRMMTAAKRLRRVTLRRAVLYRWVGALTCIVLVLMVVWTVVDPLRATPEYSLTSDFTNDGMPTEQIVRKTYFCRAETTAWHFAAESWTTVLLFCASILAFQSRHVVQHFNDSRTLAFMVYSHFVFVLFRMSTFLLSDGDVKGGTLEMMRSISYTVDQIATCIIYFLPKLTAHLYKDEMPGNLSGSAYMLRYGSPSDYARRQGNGYDGGIRDGALGHVEDGFVSAVQSMQSSEGQKSLTDTTMPEAAPEVESKGRPSEDDQEPELDNQRLQSTGVENSTDVVTKETASV